MHGDAPTVLDVANPLFLQDPYPTYARIREQGAPVWARLEEDYESEGCWLFAGYDDALKICQQTQTMSKFFRERKPNAFRTPFDLHLLNRDGADHVRLRRAVTGYFSSQSLAALSVQARSVAEGLRAQFETEGGGDLISDYAERIPLLVIAAMVGVPESDVALLRRWAKAIFVDSLTVTRAGRDLRKQSVIECIEYLRGLLADPVFMKQPHMISDLARLQKQGGLSEDELLGMLAFLLVAGHETTINLIGNALWLLLTHPEQRAILHVQGDGIDAAIEEVLRFESPAQRTTFRVSNEVIRFPGAVMEPGAQVIALLGAANRDPKVFERPDVFDVTRKHNPHLAFGKGVHNCLGKNLARLEGRIAVEVLLPLLDRFDPVCATPVWLANSFVRGLVRLPVALRH